MALRAMAEANPSAVYRDPLTREEVLASPCVASPLRLLECSPISDGGGALVVASEGTDPALQAWGMGFRYDRVSFAESMPATGCGIAAERALRGADVALADVDVALLYDSYSVTLMIELEEIGFCGPGESPAFIASGETGLGGTAPVNTHEGLLSHSHCGSAAGIHHLTEAVRQLRGQGSAQVDGAEVALVHAEGGILSANCTAVLTR